MEVKNITQLLKKKPWRRLVSEDAEVQPMRDAQYYDLTVPATFGVRYRELSNADLLNESCEGAHMVNSRYFSQRPIYDLVEREVQVTDADGNVTTKKVKEWKIQGYENVETVRSGLPEMIIKQKTSHIAKNGIEIANEGGDHKLFDQFRAYKDLSGVDTAWMDAIYSCGKCGDAAIYLYTRNGNIEYTVFSFLKGDVLFPHTDDQRRPMLVRLYQLRGRTAVDVFTTEEISTWVQYADKENKEDGVDSWWGAVKGWFKNTDFKVSEDGWRRVSRTSAQLDKETFQVVYLRFDDTPIGSAMDNINAFDRGLSYVSDKVRSTAFSKLFLKSAKIKNLPPLSSGEEVIGVENADAEMLRSSSAEYLTPPDISNIATINLKNTFDAIMQSTMSIDLQPEILKSGADSSQTLKLLLRREIQYCHVMWPQIRPAAQQIVEVLKGLVAKIEGNGDFTRLKISVWNTPWVPQDEQGRADMVTKLLYAGIISKESARHELNLAYSDDAELVSREAEEELYRKTFVPLKAKAEAEGQFGTSEGASGASEETSEETNPFKPDNGKPKIDNNSDRKDIADNEPIE